MSKPRKKEKEKIMSLLMRLCALVVSALCLPMHLISMTGLSRAILQRVAPLRIRLLTASYNRKMRGEKTELFRSLSDFCGPGGRLALLEIGCGTGANLEFYPRGAKVTCTDPNPHLRRYLKEAMDANDHLAYGGFVVSSGEDVGSVEDEAVDVVVCTLVLCSVDDVPRLLREVQRILRPGGAFFFLEHVAADRSTWAYFLQHVFQPVWHYIGDGCKVTQETWKHLESAGFSELKMRHIEPAFFFLIKPHIIGYAVK